MDPNFFEGVPFILNKNISNMGFEGILSSLLYADKKDVKCYDGFFQMRQM